MLASVEEKIRVVVAVGGTAGWLTAYSLVRRLGNLLEITLVKSGHLYHSTTAREALGRPDKIRAWRELRDIEPKC